MITAPPTPHPRTPLYPYSPDNPPHVAAVVAARTRAAGKGNPWALVKTSSLQWDDLGPEEYAREGDGEGDGDGGGGGRGGDSRVQASLDDLAGVCVCVREREGVRV